VAGARPVEDLPDFMVTGHCAVPSEIRPHIAG
jgi:hypothetical protein